MAPRPDNTSLKAGNVNTRRRRLIKQLGAACGASILPWRPLLAHASAPGTVARYPRDIALHRLDPRGSAVVGRLQLGRVYEGDTLLDIARRYDLGYWDIVLANPDTDIWFPEPGSNVLIPRRFILPDAPREGIVVNVAEMRLYY